MSSLRDLNPCWTKGFDPTSPSLNSQQDRSFFVPPALFFVLSPSFSSVFSFATLRLKGHPGSDVVDPSLNPCFVDEVQSSRDPQRLFSREASSASGDPYGPRGSQVPRESPWRMETTPGPRVKAPDANPARPGSSPWASTSDSPPVLFRDGPRTRPWSWSLSLGPPPRRPQSRPDPYTPGPDPRVPAAAVRGVFDVLGLSHPPFPTE